MRILVFGGSGQLGHEVVRRALDLHFDVIAPVFSEVDVANQSQVEFLAQKIKPDVIINGAAYTAVDAAEKERELAMRVNHEGTRNVARAARQQGARLMYISTDYVFPGNVPAPLDENAPTGPLNVYGASKLAGEQAVLEELGGRGLIVRTSSLHGAKGDNFVHAMIKLFKERDEVNVVYDQEMSPTWAGWLAEVLLDLCRIECSGVVHATSAGATNWYEFAREIYRRTRSQIAREVRLNPITAAEFGRPALRPAYSVLDCTRLEGFIGRPTPAWQDGLTHHLKELGYS